ncbi:hypothetical protein DPMN_179483 [Dreissena polymorpha]|uniref:Uncharacterized protein n=1 Tax=Dreissena polymorpha TaxID=45954 RepID=A0A9D4EEL2_DREPO|nr:hypothetical protein DPMN_179483 [Dreissena polymorpha]
MKINGGCIGAGTGDGLGEENCPAPGGHVFKQTRIIFEISLDNIRTNVLIKIHEDSIKNVTSRLTRKIPHTLVDWTTNVTLRVLTMKTTLPLVAITNVLTKFHEDSTKNVITRVDFKLVQDMIGPHDLTKFHEYRTIKVTNVLTKFHEQVLTRITP